VYRPVLLEGCDKNPDKFCFELSNVFLFGVLACFQTLVYPVEKIGSSITHLVVRHNYRNKKGKNEMDQTETQTQEP
jgi:hypothetical protein